MGPASETGHEPGDGGARMHAAVSGVLSFLFCWSLKRFSVGLLNAFLLVFETLQHHVHVQKHQSVHHPINKDLNKAPHKPDPLIRPDRNLRHFIHWPTPPYRFATLAVTQPQIISMYNSESPLYTMFPYWHHQNECSRQS